MLDKRKLAVIDHNNTEVHGNDENDADCDYEWLVKWTGLDYSHATWELENASFLVSLEAVKLMTDYEIRHQQAKKEVHPLTEDEVVISFLSSKSIFKHKHGINSRIQRGIPKCR